MLDTTVEIKQFFQDLSKFETVKPMHKHILPTHQIFKIQNCKTYAYAHITH